MASIYHLKNIAFQALCGCVSPSPPAGPLGDPWTLHINWSGDFCKCHSGFEQIMWSGGTSAALPGGFVDTNSYLDPARWRDGGKTKKPKNCFHCSLPVFFWASACPSNPLDDSLQNSPWWREIETDSSWFTNWNDSNFKHLVRGGFGGFGPLRWKQQQPSQKGLPKLDIWIHYFTHDVHLTHIITKS